MKNVVVRRSARNGAKISMFRSVISSGNAENAENAEK